MLRLRAAQAETLWDELLPVEVRGLPEDLAGIDGLLRDPALFEPIAAHWERPALERGRPTIAIETYVRLMVVKQRSGWGYETLVREVSDSLHLRRFCLIPLTARVPDESTIRKLTRRLGAEIVAKLTRGLIEKASGERRFRPRAARIDSTVVEADIKYPTDAELALQGARALAREGRKLAAGLRQAGGRVRDRSRSISRAVRLIGRTLRRRTGEAKAEVMRLNERAGRLIRRSVGEARRLAGEARRAARGRGARAKLKAAARLEELAERCERVADQIAKRVRGEKIENRLVSIADPEARPIRKGKLGKPTEFGYVEQLCELTENTKPGARGLILPPATAPGNPGREHAPARHSRRAQHDGAHPARGGARRRLRRPALCRAADRHPARAALRRRPLGSRLAPHPPPPRPLQGRDGGPHQPPQAPLRPLPLATQGPPGPANLVGLGNPRLQPRHARRPHRLTH